MTKTRLRERSVAQDLTLRWNAEAAALEGKNYSASAKILGCLLWVPPFYKESQANSPTVSSVKLT